MKIKLSVIIPFFNVVDYLSEAIDSVMNQSEISMEIILIDDGSTDGSHNIAQKYEQQYSNIKLITQKNGGLGKARNVGVLEANGEYIVFHDSDDIVVKNSYSEMIKQIDQSQSDFIVGNVARINSSGIWYSNLHKYAFPKSVSNTTIFEHNELINDTTAWNKIIRRKFWESQRAKFPENVLYEDIPVILPLYINAKVDVYSKLMYLWRSRSAGDSSITQFHDEQNMKDRMAAVNHVFEVLKKQAVELLPIYNEKVLTNDFQIYLKEFYKQDDKLFNYIYNQISLYLEHIEINSLIQLPLHLRLQYFLIKTESPKKLLEYLNEYRDGRIVNAITTYHGKEVVVNSWTQYLPDSIKFSEIDKKISAKVINVHIDENQYVISVNQQIPYLFVDVPKFLAGVESGVSSVQIVKRFSILKRLLISMFAAEEISTILYPSKNKFFILTKFGKIFKKIVGSERYQKMRLQTRKPSLPYQLKIPVNKHLSGRVFFDFIENDTKTFLDVNSERPAIRTISYHAKNIEMVTGVNSQWQFTFSQLNSNDFIMIDNSNSAVEVEVIIKASGFDIFIIGNQHHFDQLILVSNSAREVIEKNDLGYYHIGTDFTERKYELFLKGPNHEGLFPVQMVKTTNYSYEQTAYLQNRAIQLQERQLSSTLVFKQWEPMKWYEGTPLRRQAFKAIIYPLLRLLPLQRIIVYGSFWGKNFSDNPRAIYEYVSEKKVPYKQVAILQHNLGQYSDLTNITFVKPGSFKYYYFLSVAKYLFNNVNFDNDYIKRDSQIEVQTMHGTPLKKLGLDSPGEIAPRMVEQYIEKNRRWDYLTVPSDYVARISQTAFRHKAKVLPVGYARNDELFFNNNASNIRNLKKKLGFPQDKKILLYAPTWRVKGEFVPQIDFEKLKKDISNEYFVILKLHQFMSNVNIPVSANEFVKVVADEVEISDLYLISDALITDYSSVMFDFAVLKRPMIFYVYDYKKYSQKMRPLYFDFIKEAPGAWAVTQEDLVNAINSLSNYEIDFPEKITAFRQNFVQYDDGHSREKLLSTIGLINKDK